MGARENTEFVDSPILFVNAHPVDLMDTLTSRTYTMGLSPPAATGAALGAITSVLGMDNIPMEFDLLPVQHAGNEWIGLRPVIRNFVAPDLRPLFPEAARPISAYYFPYKAGDIDGTSQATLERTVGWVDVPRVAPRYEFVFTGSMNGCELVLTDSPTAGCFRVWHFQNAASGQHPRLRKAGWPGAGAIGSIHYWHEFTAYGEERRSGHSVRSTEPDRMAAWNFLHYERRKWWLYCQPLEYTILVGASVVYVPSLYSRRPFRVDLDPHLAVGQTALAKYGPVPPAPAPATHPLG